MLACRELLLYCVLLELILALQVTDFISGRRNAVVAEPPQFCQAVGANYSSTKLRRSTADPWACEFPAPLKGVSGKADVRYKEDLKSVWVHRRRHFGASIQRERASCSACEVTVDMRCTSQKWRGSYFHRVVGCLVPTYGLLQQVRDDSGGSRQLCILTWGTDGELSIEPFLTSLLTDIRPRPLLISEDTECASSKKYMSAEPATSFGALEQYVFVWPILPHIARRVPLDMGANVRSLHRDVFRAAGPDRRPRVVLVASRQSPALAPDALSSLRGALRGLAAAASGRHVGWSPWKFEPVDTLDEEYSGNETLLDTFRIFAHAVGVVGFHGDALVNTMYAAHAACVQEITPFRDAGSGQIWRTHERLAGLNPFLVWERHLVSLKSLQDRNRMSVEEWGRFRDTDEAIGELRSVPLAQRDVDSIVGRLSACLESNVYLDSAPGRPERTPATTGAAGQSARGEQAPFGTTLAGVVPAEASNSSDGTPSVAQRASTSSSTLQDGAGGEQAPFGTTRAGVVPAEVSNSSHGAPSVAQHASASSSGEQGPLSIAPGRVASAEVSTLTDSVPASTPDASESLSVPQDRTGPWSAWRDSDDEQAAFGILSKCTSVNLGYQNHTSLCEPGDDSCCAAPPDTDGDDGFLEDRQHVSAQGPRADGAVAQCSGCDFTIDLRCSGLGTPARHSFVRRLTDCLLPAYALVQQAREAVGQRCILTWTNAQEFTLEPILQIVASDLKARLVDESLPCVQRMPYHSVRPSREFGASQRYVDAWPDIPNIAGRAPLDIAASVRWFHEDVFKHAGPRREPRLVLLTRRGGQRAFSPETQVALMDSGRRVVSAVGSQRYLPWYSWKFKPVDLSLTEYIGAGEARATVQMFAHAVGVVGFHGGGFVNTLFISHPACVKEVTTHMDFDGKQLWRTSRALARLNPNLAWEAIAVPLQQLLHTEGTTQEEWAAVGNKTARLEGLPFVQLTTSDVNLLEQKLSACLDQLVFLPPQT